MLLKLYLHVYRAMQVTPSLSDRYLTGSTTSKRCCLNLTGDYFNVTNIEAMHLIREGYAYLTLNNPTKALMVPLC